MALSYERRHLPDDLAFHNGPSGGKAILVGNFLLLESDSGTGQDVLLLESDAGAQIDGLKLEDSV